MLPIGNTRGGCLIIILSCPAGPPAAQGLTGALLEITAEIGKRAVAAKVWDREDLLAGFHQQVLDPLNANGMNLSV